MKALSLRQPYAGLVALGVKRIETRSWGTAYRGFMAIHAAQGEPLKLDPAVEPYFTEVVAKHGMTAFEARGCIVALCTLADVVRLPGYKDWIGVVPTSLMELAFGDYAPGRCMWKLTEIRRMKTPIRCAGALGLFNLPPALIYGMAAEVVV